MMIRFGSVSSRNLIGSNSNGIGVLATGFSPAT
jgi:hypothetical protein